MKRFDARVEISGGVTPTKRRSTWRKQKCYENYFVKFCEKINFLSASKYCIFLNR